MSDALIKSNKAVDILDAIEKVLNEVITNIGDAIEYDGFDAVKFRQKILATWTPKQISMALVVLIKRGSNIDNIKKKGITDGGKTVIVGLETLGVKSKKTDGSSITLARIGVAFPLELLTAVRMMKSLGKFSSIVSAAKIDEIAKRTGVDGKVPSAMLIPGIASVVPPKYAKFYFELSIEFSVIFNAKEDQKINTKRLTANLGGRSSVVTQEEYMNWWEKSYPTVDILKQTDENKKMTEWDTLKVNFGTLVATTTSVSSTTGKEEVGTPTTSKFL